MITPSFSLTATERVLPKLALDFTTAALDSRITFTRTTGASNPATYVNSSGVVTAATNNQPRFDYDPVTLACKGLLIEESRINLTKYSQDFSNAAWTLGNATIGSSTTSPDGTSNGQSLMETVTSGGHRYYATSSITVVNGTTYTHTVFVKANGRSYVRLADTAVTNVTCFFDISGGTVGTVGSAVTASSITSYGNGWYRCSMTYVMVGTAATPALNISTDGSTVSYAGDVTKGVYIWGAQLEAGAFATSYIPTTSAALTRNADVAVMTGTNFSDWFNASEGTFTLTSIAGTNVGYASGAYTQRGIEVSSATNAYMTIARLNTATTARLLVVDGTTQVAIDQSNYTQNTASTFTFGYKLNNYVFAGNGAAVTTDTAATVPTCTTLNIGKATTSEGFLNGWIRKINYYPMRLTNAEVQAFSKG